MVILFRFNSHASCMVNVGPERVYTLCRPNDQLHTARADHLPPILWFTTAIRPNSTFNPYMYVHLLLLLPWLFCFCRGAFAFAVALLLLPWRFCFCRGAFAFAVALLLLPWRFCFCRGSFAFAVALFLLPWRFCFCRGSFAFAVALLPLPWRFCFCRGAFAFAVTVVGHRRYWIWLPPRTIVACKAYSYTSKREQKTATSDKHTCVFSFYNGKYIFSGRKMLA